MTHPDILKAERFGSREDFENCILYCEECSKIRNKLYDSYYTDKQGNTFCCESCAMEYHGIRFMEA